MQWYILNRSMWFTWLSVVTWWTNLELSWPVIDDGIEAYKAKFLAVIQVNSMPVIRDLIVESKRCDRQSQRLCNKEMNNHVPFTAVCAIRMQILLCKQTNVYHLASHGRASFV